MRRALARITVGALALAAWGSPASSAGVGDRLAPGEEQVSTERPATGTIASAADARRLRSAPTRLTGPIDRVAFMGDSLIADLRKLMPELRPNDLVPDIAAALAAEPALDGITVENLGRPGQSLVYVREDFRRHDPGITTLTAATHTFFADRPVAQRPDLVVIATTAIDISVMSETPIETLTPELLAALQDVVAHLERLGIQVVVLPVFPVSDELFDRFSGMATNTTARVDRFNHELWASDLPLLFERFEGLDIDGLPGNDPAFYADAADTEPDDGVHPGPLGRQRYADNVLDALIPRLIAANTPLPWRADACRTEAGRR